MVLGQVSGASRKKNGLMFRSPGGASHLVFLGQQKPSKPPQKWHIPTSYMGLWWIMGVMYGLYKPLTMWDAHLIVISDSTLWGQLMAGTYHINWYWNGKMIERYKWVIYNIYIYIYIYIYIIIHMYVWSSNKPWSWFKKKKKTEASFPIHCFGFADFRASHHRLQDRRRMAERCKILCAADRDQWLKTLQTVQFTEKSWNEGLMYI